MRRYRGKDGGDRLWYDDGEIEEIMAAELHRAGLFPTAEVLAVDIERFVEVHLRARFDQHADLGPDVLGVTEFVPGERPCIRINRDLTGSALDDDECPLGILGRWRATVAHEAAHVLLHSGLFEGAANQRLLFDREDGPAGEPRVFRSLKRDVSFEDRPVDWREVQANKGMAALLMPRPAFLAASEGEIDAMGSPGRSPSRAEAATRVVASRLSARFQVSRSAALIRMETLGILPRLMQPDLRLGPG